MAVVSKQAKIIPKEGASRLNFPEGFGGKGFQQIQFKAFPIMISLIGSFQIQYKKAIYLFSKEESNTEKIIQ